MILARLKGWARSARTALPLVVTTPFRPADDARMMLFRDARRVYARRLSGRGLEIGALARPMVTHPGMQVEYVDQLPLDELRRMYPELATCDVVSPDIVADATTLQGVPDRAYDFLIAAHVLEHLANPILALENWCRVVRPGGHVYIVLPDKRLTFDRPRPRTTLEHLILDYREPSEVRDFEHYLEYARFVHRATGDAALAEARKLRDARYSIHFHVFTPMDALALVRWCAENVHPVTIAAGPDSKPSFSEFHLLLQVNGKGTQAR